MSGIYTKLLEVQKEVGAISKDSTNPFFKSKYFDINKLIEVVNPILSKNGLVLLQPIKDGKQLSIIIDSESGDSVESELMLPTLNDPQKLGSAVTYYRRYTLGSLLALSAEDDDANTSSKESKKLPNLIDGSDKHKSAIEFVKNGGSILDIKKKYTLTKDVEDKLKTV